MDADRAGLLAIGERHEQIGQLCVGTPRRDETGDVIAPMPAASLADDRERRFANVGQGERAVARHGLKREAEAARKRDPAYRAVYNERQRQRRAAAKALKAGIDRPRLTPDAQRPARSR